MYTIQFAYLDKSPINRPKSRVVSTAEKLEYKGSITQVKQNKEIIEKIRTPEGYSIYY